MDALIALLMVSCLASQAFGQDVEIRGTQDKVRADGGQRGTIYNQRHLSPHRMMHFGKRPASLPPPLITTPQVFDLYQDRPLQLDESNSNSRYPYLLYLELERGKTLRSLPEELSAHDKLDTSGNMMYSYERPELKFFRYGSENNLGEIQQVVGKQAEGPRFLKLINSNEVDASNVNNNDEAATAAQVSAERAQPSTNSQDDGASAQQAISVSSRSIQNGGRTNSLNLPKAYISSLFARQGSSSMPSYGLFNKKAEPKDNYFMHFGRK